jgi:hypothetical protein
MTTSNIATMKFNYTEVIAKGETKLVDTTFRVIGVAGSFDVAAKASFVTTIEIRGCQRRNRCDKGDDNSDR